MRRSPMWPDLEAVAPTLAYDARVMDDSTLPAELGAAVRVPTQVLTGGDDAARAVTASLPDRAPTSDQGPHRPKPSAPLDQQVAVVQPHDPPSRAVCEPSVSTLIRPRGAHGGGLTAGPTSHTAMATPGR
jgi:hypothetical protein